VTRGAGAAIVACFVLAACTDERPRPEATKPAPARSAPVAEPAPGPEPVELEKASEPLERPGDLVGVAECDEYAARYRRCIAEKLPAAARASTSQALDHSLAAWRKAAEHPAGRKSLADACRTASESVAALCE
jgi:hypothetical protein